VPLPVLPFTFFFEGPRTLLREPEFLSLEKPVELRNSIAGSTICTLPSSLADKRWAPSWRSRVSLSFCKGTAEDRPTLLQVASLPPY